MRCRLNNFRYHNGAGDRYVASGSQRWRPPQGQDITRRYLLENLATVGRGLCLAQLTASQSAFADGLPGFKKDLRPVRQRGKVDESEYTKGSDGLKYYDVRVGSGALAGEGDRVAVHYECKWRGITFVTSRQGVGVTGGEPYGFDVGATGSTRALRGLDLGIRGMRVGGVRKLILPPDLAYGERGVGEIPGCATLDMEVELLSIKQSPFKGRARGEPAES